MHSGRGYLAEVGVRLIIRPGWWRLHLSGIYKKERDGWERVVALGTLWVSTQWERNNTSDGFFLAGLKMFTQTYIINCSVDYKDPAIWMKVDLIKRGLGTKTVDSWWWRRKRDGRQEVINLVWGWTEKGTQCDVCLSSFFQFILFPIV